MQIQPVPISPDSIAAAVAHLRAGSLVILPTDTVYGVVADAGNDAAVRALYAAKGKGEEAPLQLLFAPGVDADRFADISGVGAALITALGPGGWTVIVPAAAGWQSPALAGGATVGVRLPDAEAVWRVVEGLGRPVVATSANRHGGPSPTTCADAVAQLGEFVALALDGGPTRAGLDSTVVDCVSEPPRILREGAIDRQTIARILNLSDITVLRSVRS